MFEFSLELYMGCSIDIEVNGGEALGVVWDCRIK